MSENKDSPKDVQSSLGAHTTITKASALSHVGLEPHELNKVSQEGPDKISFLSHKQEGMSYVISSGQVPEMVKCSRPSHPLLPPLFRAQCFCAAQAQGFFVCHSSVAVSYSVCADGEEHRRTAVCGRVCILRTAWKTHTREEARDHDAENQDEDLPG